MGDEIYTDTNSTIPNSEAGNKTIKTTTDDIIVVTIWSFMLIYALVANVLVQIGILRSHSMRKATSYWLILSLSVCDIFMILISLTHIVPATAFHNRFVEIMSPRNIWAIFFYDLFWYTGVLKLGLMATNRFVSIVYPTHYREVFSPRRTMQIIAGVYAVGTLVSIPTLFACCHTVWNHELYVTAYEPLDTPYFIVDIMVNSVSLVMMIFCYAVIIIRVRDSRKALNRYRSTMKRINSAEPNGTSIASGVATTTTYAAIATPPRSSVSKREMRLFLQFFIVSMVFLGTWVTWQWLPRVSASKWIYFSMTSFFFINNGVNPTVYLIFNTSLRKEVKQVLCFPSRYFFNKDHNPRLPNTGSKGSTSDPERSRNRRKRHPNSSTPTSSSTSSQHCNNNEKKKGQDPPESGVTLRNRRAEEFEQSIRKSISQAEEVERSARRSFSLCRSTHSINQIEGGKSQPSEIARQRASCISLLGNPRNYLGAEPRRVSVIPAMSRNYEINRKPSYPRSRIPFSRTVEVLAQGDGSDGALSEISDQDTQGVPLTLHGQIRGDSFQYVPQWEDSINYSNYTRYPDIDNAAVHRSSISIPPSHLETQRVEMEQLVNKQEELQKVLSRTPKNQPYSPITDSVVSELHPLLITSVIEEENSVILPNETDSMVEFSPPTIRSSISADLIFSNPGTAHSGSTPDGLEYSAPKGSVSLEDIEELGKYMVPEDIIVMTSTV